MFFSEFEGLGDPIIFGLPTIDAYGGVEVTRNTVWLADLYINRLVPPRRDGTVSALSPLDIPRISSATTVPHGPLYIPSVSLSDDAWYPITVYVNNDELNRTLGCDQPFWLEEHSTIIKWRSLIL